MMHPSLRGLLFRSVVGTRSSARVAARPRCQATAVAPSVTRASVYYQGAGVPTGIRSSGKVYTIRNASGSDGAFYGVDPVATEVDMHDGRGAGLNIDEHGFTLLPHTYDHIDYYDNQQVIGPYYRECEELLLRHTGATRAVAFDHNLRAKQRKEQGVHLADGNAVQEPLLSYGVHGDYTMTSAPARVRLLSEPLRENDTLRVGVESPKPPIDPDDVERLLRGRYCFFNVWRNITTNPVERFPLAMLDYGTISLENLVVFEVRYSDRVGENYFCRHDESHRWYYFPRMIRDEAVVLKCWDSRGRDFIDDSVLLNSFAQGKGTEDEPKTVPATFALHSPFVDPTTRADAPDRESLEIRCVAFWEE